MRRFSHWFVHLVKLFRHKAKDSQAIVVLPQRRLKPGLLAWQLGSGWALEVHGGMTYLVSPNRRKWEPLIPMGWYWPCTSDN